MIISGVTLNNTGFVTDSSLVTANLVANYDPDTGISGSTFLDSSGHGYNATFLNSTTTYSPTPVTLANGHKVLQLTSASSQYYAYLSGYTTMGGTSVTFDAWFNTASASTAQTVIAEFGQIGASPAYFNGGWNDAIMGVTTSAIAAGDYNNSTSGYVTGPTYSANTWYNVVLTTAPGLYTLYVNGVAGWTTATTRTNATPSPVYYPIGYSDSAHTYLGGVQGNFNGYLGPVKLYNAALTAQQVQQNFNAFRWRYGI